MATELILVTSDAQVQEHLTHVLAEADSLEIVTVVSDAQGAVAALERHPDVGIVVVDADVDGGQGHTIARRVGTVAPLVGIVMLVEDAGPNALSAAMEVGARSVVPRGASLDEIVTRFDAVARWSTSARAAVEADLSAGRGGRVVAVAGAKGGVGASVVALLTAAATAVHRSVTLVDFDLAAGDLTAFAGVHTRRSVVDLAEVSAEITGRMLRETSYDVPGGLRLLPAPNEGERGEEMTAEAARSIVNALRFESDLAVIDVGSRLDEATATVIEHADVVLLVTTPDLPSLRAARRAVVQWERLAVRQPAAVDLVLNRRSRRDQVTAQLVERVVERPVAFTVPVGGEDFDTAMNTATLLEEPTDVHEAISRVAASVVERPTAGSTGPAGAERDDEQELEKLIGRGMRRPRRESRSRRRRTRRTADAEDGESGAALVELPIVLMLGLLILLACGQGIFWASGLLVAHSAAQDGARTVGIAAVYDASVEAEARQDVRDALPSPWSGKADVSVSPSEVRVQVSTPTVFPGAALSSSSTAAVYREGR